MKYCYEVLSVETAERVGELIRRTCTMLEVIQGLGSKDYYMSWYRA
ncbi:MAG: hypothetical protein GKR95_21040 [Gammaproteobacteria bacterium]|nr:hypothetical protein [Gammaproteobacteria bacterium]